MAMQEDDERIRGLVIRLARSEKMKSTDLPVVDDLMVSLHEQVVIKGRKPTIDVSVLIIYEGPQRYASTACVLKAEPQWRMVS